MGWERRVKRNDLGATSRSISDLSGTENLTLDMGPREAVMTIKSPFSDKESCKFNPGLAPAPTLAVIHLRQIT